MLRRAVVCALVLIGVTAVTAPPVFAEPAPTAATAGTSDTNTPGMLLPHGRTTPLSAEVRAQLRQKATIGDCQLLDNQASESPRHCRPDNPPAASCTGYTSQTTAPATIRVMVRTSSTTYRIDTVPFQTYVEDVLPNEWNATDDGDAVRSGLVAIKSYAWYWVTHYGGYYGTSPTSKTCFDVTDDMDFQVYKAGSGSKDPTTVTRANAMWPVTIRRNGQVLQAQYVAGLNDPNDPQKPDTFCGQAKNGKQLSQTGSERCNASNEYNNPYRYNVILRLYYGDDIDLNSTVQLRTQHDFLFQHRSTGGTVSAAKWYIADGYPTTFTFGVNGDVPIVATNGDGFATAAVWRPSASKFYVANALHQVAHSLQFGTTGDVPVAAHYQGLDAPTQLAVWRPRNGAWYAADAAGQVGSTTLWGASGDIPVPGRWLSPDADTLAVWRPSSGAWYLRGGGTVPWGQRGDVPAPADYDGDGKTDIAVYRPSTSTFYIRNSPDVRYGTRGDIAVTGDFTGDGRSDIAVYRPTNGVLYVRGLPSVSVGKGTPIGAAPLRG